VTARPHLTAEPRVVVGKKVAALRRDGKLPAVVYGHGRESESIQLDAHEFTVLRRHTGRNALVDLKIGSGRATPVLLHGIHEHPVTRAPLHVDFFVVSMTEEMAVDVPISVTGESVAVDRLGGTLLHLRETVHVRALPADLPSSIELDITPLETFEETLHAGDLRIPERVTLLTDPTEPVARVQPPRLEVEPVAEAPEGEEGEAEAGEPAAEAEGTPAAESES
jgi:large subunit ribosomal protein L25